MLHLIECYAFSKDENIHYALGYSMLTSFNALMTFERVEWWRNKRK